MRVAQLDHLNLTVADLDATADWYARVFGFEQVEGGVQEGVRWGVLRGGDAMLCVYEHPELRYQDRFAMQKEGLHALAHFGLRIADVEAWLETLARERVPVHYGGVVTWPHSRAWYVSDPTGYEIEVVAWNEDRIDFSGVAQS